MSRDFLAWSAALIALPALLLLAGRLWRMRRARGGLSSEERRLRDDPRFAEMWVRQYRPRGDVSAVTREAPDDGSPPARPESGC